jgi:hypothetical protein
MNSDKRCIKKTRLFLKLHVKLSKCKELKEVVIKASKDLKTKDELINSWKSKYEEVESEHSELKAESDGRIDELEADMEKILMEK